MVKHITLLGSTGTIGKNTLDVVRKNKSAFQIYALAAKSSLEKLKEQADEFNPKVVVLTDRNAYEKAKDCFSSQVKVLFGEEGLKEIVTPSSVHFVMAGMVGAAGLSPFIAALEAGKRIGLANKEIMVMAGEYLHQKYPDFLKQIIPVDSEHSAIFQCLEGRESSEIESIILTASGGPFRTRPHLEGLSLEEALDHPNWKMGAKISIDSASLMNKGLEVMEARWLFPVKLKQIKVVIHPQSIIHSMVEFCDGALLAHLGVADMRIPIQYALSYPRRILNDLPRVNFPKLRELTFEEPDWNKFPNLSLAFKALENGGVCPAVLNAANEMAVQAFIDRKISFTDIFKCNQYVFAQEKAKESLTLSTILKADARARKEAASWILKYSSLL